jgi:hypothetical protein
VLAAAFFALEYHETSHHGWLVSHQEREDMRAWVHGQGRTSERLDERDAIYRHMDVADIVARRILRVEDDRRLGALSFVETPRTIVP